MSIKQYKPTSPGVRGMSTIIYRHVLSGTKPTKSLLKGGKAYAGRNNRGRISVRHKGGGHKRLMRDVDFVYNKKNIPAKIASVEYDPHRSAFIALANYADGEKRYVLVPKNMPVGTSFIVSETAPITVGNRLLIGNMPVGTFIYNIEIKPGNGGKIARSAGNYAEVVAHDAGFTHVKMPSTEVRRFVSTCWASIGEVSNAEHRLVVIGKAGRSRWKGIRPTVRGSVMNPVDHPHGGGEGRQGRGLRRAKSLWGRPTGKGQKSRSPKKYSNVFIVSRRKVGKRR